MTTSNILYSLYKYKAWSEDQLINIVRTASIDEHPEELKEALYYLAHINMVDQIFISRIKGEPELFESTVTDEEQNIDDLAQRFQSANEWFIRYLESVTREELDQRVQFTFTDGKPGDMSKEEILGHILSHGLLHRGGICTILPPELLKGYMDHFTTFLKS
ncbi:damage-inducible protein DinB [Pseudomonas sp. A46]|nr:DinB family protein [Pseudomonas sp. A46]OWJ98241.1 damage-inducible protein DinB [Pseudomonas sp. A46]